MRKIAYLTLVLLSISSFSQEYGLKGGVNIGKERISDSGVSITSDGSVAFLAGFYVDFPVADQVSISPELIYHVDGGKFNLFGFTGKDKLSYISVPVMLKYHASDKFNIHGGPQLGFLIDATSEANGMSVDSSDDVKGTNFSFALGGELSLSSMNLGVRYVLGLANVSDIPDSSGEVKLNTLQIYVGIPLN